MDRNSRIIMFDNTKDFKLNVMAIINHRHISNSQTHQITIWIISDKKNQQLNEN